ncbi:GNAT family N-acetyltransferase [Bacillus infantis]|uniref:GNAT family N-acetyltransferase n=1 Tax=Bacillus infantis TaxID=324767 RepID=A0A5D4R2T3_9BACI|nr:GNAT family N-acetyltransferase [Bacillus infantis]TYS45667.1 GNAT family N-acetyltransferase [Bacillus infantis]
MEYEIIKAGAEHEEALLNLFQFYIYDFSEFIDAHVGDNGRFSEYPLQDYWTEEGHYPYVIKLNGHYAGFVLVAEDSESLSINEFFILKKYRREGLGKQVAKDIFGLHKGRWEIFQIEKNKPAQGFWRSVIDEYTSGEFTERKDEHNRVIQEFVSRTKQNT